MALSTQAPAAVSTQQLPPCSASPNCVSSQAADAGHYIAPFKIVGEPKAAWSAFKQVLAAQSRTVITRSTEDMLHAEATSLVFRFVDDVDALLDADRKLVHIRSASRVGYSDLGVNRRRVEDLRKRLQRQGVIE